ncbi:unnamed protein product [Caenorhabditis brenneri]
MLPFYRLPLIVRNEVIRSMDHKDCINLAMTSKRAAEKIRLARIKTLYAVIEIDRVPRIVLWGGRLILFPNQELQFIKGRGVMDSKELKKWTDGSSKISVENTAKVYKEINNFIKFEDVHLVFGYDYKNVTTVKEVLSNPTFQKWKYCLFLYEKIDSEELKMILDMASPEKTVDCRANECPIDFRHENAFKFRNCVYKDARWVKIEDLYEMNCHNVILERTSFTQTEIKAFIKHWVNSENDMFCQLNIMIDEAIDSAEILDGLNVLDIEQLGLFYTIIKPSKTRKRMLLALIIVENNLRLGEWAPGFSKPDVDVSEYEIIMKKQGVFDLLMEKKQMEMELEKANGDQEREISNRLIQLDIEIEGYGVYFVNGKATLQLP